MTTNYQLPAKVQQIMYIRKYVEEQMPRLIYHNPAHAQDVAHTAYVIASCEGLNSREQFIAETAGWLHDVVYKSFAKDNEEQSCADATRIMRLIGYRPTDIADVNKMIMATKLGTAPSSRLEMVIQDADLWNLGTNECFERSEAFRTELGVPANEKWYGGLAQLLNNHSYKTEFAQRLLTPGLLENRAIAKLMYDSAKQNNSQSIPRQTDAKHEGSRNPMEVC